MSTIINNILKAGISVFVIILIASVPLCTFAQCTLIKKKSGKSALKIETPDSYQYNRTSGEYVAVLTHAVLIKTPAANSFHLVIKYSGTTNMAHLLNLSFRFQDSDVLSSKLKLIRLQKTDNVKLSTRVYEAPLNGADVAALLQKPLKEIVISAGNKSEPVAIPVNDPGFMQQQIGCLQKLLN